MLNVLLASNLFVREKHHPSLKSPAQQEPALASAANESTA